MTRPLPPAVRILSAAEVAALPKRRPSYAEAMEWLIGRSDPVGDLEGYAKIELYAAAEKAYQAWCREVDQ